MSREPMTRASVPSAPPLFSLTLQLLLGFAMFVVLFVLPSCASAPLLDLAVLGGLSVWAGVMLVRCLCRPRRRPRLRVLPPQVALLPGEVGERSDGPS